MFSEFNTYYEAKIHKKSISNVEKCIGQWNRIENQGKSTKNMVKLYWQGSILKKKKVQGKADIHLIKNEISTQSMYKHQLKIDSRNNDYIWKYETLRKIQTKASWYCLHLSLIPRYSTRSTGNKRKNWQMGLYQIIKGFLFIKMKKQNTKVKMHPTKWKNIFANSILNKGLLFRIYQDTS